MRSGAHHQIDTAGQGRTPPSASCIRVAARGRKEWAGRASNHTTSFAAPSPKAAIAAGRTSPKRPAAPTQLLVDDLLGHDATCAGADGEGLGLCGQFFGAPLIFDRAAHVRQNPGPITTHRRRPLARAPRLDAAVMRETRNGVAFERNCEMNRNA